MSYVNVFYINNIFYIIYIILVIFPTKKGNTPFFLRLFPLFLFCFPIYLIPHPAAVPSGASCIHTDTESRSLPFPQALRIPAGARTFRPVFPTSAEQAVFSAEPGDFSCQTAFPASLHIPAQAHVRQTRTPTLISAVSDNHSTGTFFPHHLSHIPPVHILLQWEVQKTKVPGELTPFRPVSLQTLSPFQIPQKSHCCLPTPCPVQKMCPDRLF